MIGSVTMKTQKTELNKGHESIWLVLNFWRGIEVNARAYRSEIKAREVEGRWRRMANETYDQVEVVKVRVR